jgi:hypothetical protein
MTIIELCQEYNIEYREPGTHHHAHGPWIQTDCPYCSPNWGSFRLGFHTGKRYFNCYACGAHRTGETLALMLNLTPDQAFKLSKELRSGDDHNPHIRAVERRGTLVLPQGVGPMAFTRRKYLENRGFDPKKIARTWEVQGIGISDRMYAWRLFIPIHDRSGKMVSWTSRATDKRQWKRYCAAKPSQEEVNARYLLYGEHLVKGHAIVVHEGCTDVWATGPGAVAVSGLNVSMQQVYKISQYPVRVICFDNEDAAQKRADFLCEQLAPFPGETIRVRLEHSKDAGSAVTTGKGRRELTALRETYLANTAFGF